MKKNLAIETLLPPDVLWPEARGKAIAVPPWAFRPDQWSFAFLRGLRALAPTFEGQSLWELGVGTGLNTAFVATLAPSAHFHYSDYNNHCSILACTNISGLVPGSRERCSPLYGPWDLVTPPNGMTAPQVDVIFGCLPQVTKDGLDLTVGDRVAHYYDPALYPEARHHDLGLGLHEALLERAKAVLCPGGRIVVNLSGRPGRQCLTALFTERGYHARVVHEEMVAQHRGTTLATLAALEDEGHPEFEFFADERGEREINACAAEARRLAGEPLFHNIYVIEGTIT